jgi:hypothetical protein
MLLHLVRITRCGKMLPPEGISCLEPRKEKTMAKKSSCPVTRSEFHEHAKPVQVTVGSASMPAEVKEFSTGSFGWYLSGKTSIEVNGKPVTVQISLNMTAVGSKELPKEAEMASATDQA